MARRAPPIVGVALGLVLLPGVRTAVAEGAPPWMRALISVPSPDHDEKTDAVLLLTDTLVTVRADGRIRRRERRVYRILRPEGAKRGFVAFPYTPAKPLIGFTAWSIPATGKDFALHERDAVETALPGIANGELVSDLRAKVLQIPAATPGGMLGYEVETEERSSFIDDSWNFQADLPVRDAEYTLALAPGWSYRPTWIHHAEVAPTDAGNGQWHWSVNDVPAVPIEGAMPPWQGIAARLAISLIPPGSASRGWMSWGDVGSWYDGLVRGRRDASPEIQAAVASLTANQGTVLGRVRAITRFVQEDVRYVAIELGIGDRQPHPAADVFRNRYGDCKDKATLLASMLHEIGIESYYLLVNTTRGAVTADTPPNFDFNHAILAIAVPASVDDPTLLATFTHPKLGRIVFFDPTNPRTPFGRLAGPLQANFGLLVTPEGGELLRLPQLASNTSGVRRAATMHLDANGGLHGEVVETRIGDWADAERERLGAARRSSDEMRSLETLVATSMANFKIGEATVENRDAPEQPLVWRYSLESADYAKTNGDLLLVRPRLLGSHANGLLETDKPRRQPIEFRGPEEDTDSFEIELPPEYVVEEIPPPVVADFGFASYRSRTEVAGRTLQYTRRFEVKQPSVPVVNAEELKKLYRIITADERLTVVVKPASE